MNAFIKSLSIFVLSLSLFACGDSAEKTAEKGESAIEAMNSMSSEITSYANDDLSTMSVSELEYTKKRLNKYIKHADRAIKSINDPDTLYFGNEDDIYTNRSLALGILSEVNQEITLRKDPATIKKRNKKKSSKKELQASLEKLERLGSDFESLQRQLKFQEDFDKLPSLSVSELRKEKAVYQRIKNKTQEMGSLIKRIKSNSSWSEHKRNLSYTEQQALDNVLELFETMKKEDPFTGIIDYIDAIIIEKIANGQDFG